MFQAKDNEAKKAINEKRIKAINLELAEKLDGRDGEGESEMRDRLELVDQLRKVRSRCLRQIIVRVVAVFL